MKNGTVQVIYGPGKGKSDAAIGSAVSALGNQKTVIMIQFLKGSLEPDRMDVLKRLEPELKIFRFEKSADLFENLSEEEQAEERMNIRNGLNFAKKVMTTGECDLLVLDEILGIIDCGIITSEQLIQHLEARETEMSVVMTGKVFPEGLEKHVDYISLIQDVQVDKNHNE